MIDGRFDQKRCPDCTLPACRMPHTCVEEMGPVTREEVERIKDEVHGLSEALKQVTSWAQERGFHFDWSDLESSWRGRPYAKRSR